MKLKELFANILTVKYKHTFKEKASFSYERDGDTLYIYFEKSNGATDWKNNFCFPAKPYRRMKNKWYAHRGFLKVWKEIEPHLQRVIFDFSVNRIVIGGYSHGAAVALLCHEYCKYNRPDISENIEGWGFGAPRVVWGFMRKAVKKRFEGFTVVRNGKDIVTHMPPAILGYRHAGAILEIGRNKGYTPIESHFPSRYLKEL